MKNKLYGLILFNVLWFLIAKLVNNPVLIDPISTYVNIFKVLPDMSGHLLASLERVVLGIFISVVIGSIVGIGMALSKKLNSILSPLVYFTYPIPKFALLPIVMLLAGIGEISKITMIVLILVFQIIISIRDAVNNISRDKYNILISLGANPKQILKEVIFPAILPELFTTLRIALGVAISVLFFTETYGTEKGMGYYIVDSWMRINYLDMYAGIVLLSILGFLLFLLIDGMDRVFCKWNK
ncbi:MAG: ABC transporter permease [Bacteroidales bacterium]|nr:ABC transporter permease [Bacteroidales bacterium]